MKMYIYLMLIMLTSCNIFNTSSSSRSIVFIDASKSEKSLLDFLSDMETLGNEIDLHEITIKEKGNYYPNGIGLSGLDHENIRTEVVDRIAKVYRVDYKDSNVFLSNFYLRTATMSVPSKMLDRLEGNGYEVTIREVQSSQ